MPLTREEKVRWFIAAFVFHIIVAFCIFMRHGLNITISGWVLGIILHLSVAMEALGWLGNFIVAHMISTYLTLDTVLYLAISFGLIIFFCWLRLLRPVASDWEQ
ncbi:hypothetical protein MTR67_041525 [Solanum verrucosum]|uniref:Uncharacterized protein n=1 Tax=Solanum verrucosum TaxID=315347 RepID=A0AAF0ZST3_SOLVR|nr:hypothetical protein MTR67_041525 [Solanum verrucosum]